MRIPSRVEDVDQTPWVSVLIPTYNRATDLQVTLNSLKKQHDEHGQLEVLVLDDCSTDGTKSMVLHEFPDVRLIRLPENRGQAYGRNVLAASARGDYLIILDDDARFLEDDAVKRVVAIFSAVPDAGLIAFNIATPGVPGRPREEPNFFAHDHVTCGCALRRRALEEVGGYRALFHSQCEESDFSLRLLDKGWLIYHTNEIPVFHDFRPTERTREWLRRVRYHTARNELSMVLLQFPFWIMVPALLWKCVSHLRCGIRNRVPFSIVRAIAAFTTRIPGLLRMRKPVGTKTLKRYYGLRRFRPRSKEQIAKIELMSWKPILFCAVNQEHPCTDAVAVRYDCKSDSPNSAITS